MSTRSCHFSGLRSDTFPYSTYCLGKRKRKQNGRNEMRREKHWLFDEIKRRKIGRSRGSVSFLVTPSFRSIRFRPVSLNSVLYRIVPSRNFILYCSSCREPSMHRPWNTVPLSHDSLCMVLCEKCWNVMKNRKGQKNGFIKETDSRTSIEPANIDAS